MGYSLFILAHDLPRLQNPKPARATLPIMATATAPAWLCAFRELRSDCKIPLKLFWRVNSVESNRSGGDSLGCLAIGIRYSSFLALESLGLAT